jgi:hypothetical protein
VRRILAVFLLLGFSLPLIAPAFAPRIDEASLPACCRRKGEHHCAMAGTMQVNVSSAHRAIGARCPFAPFARVLLMMPHSLATQAIPAGVTLAVGPAAAVHDAEAGYRISADRTRRKRGPPLLLAL